MRFFKRQKPQAEPLPWYRVKNYKGNLTESEKRTLDSFRMKAEHPAASIDSLPIEVQNYINQLELAEYDNKQERLVGSCFALSAVGALLLYQVYSGKSEIPAIQIVAGAGFLVVPWIFYPSKYRKNFEAFWPSSDGHDPSNEALLREWELEFLVRQERKDDWP